MFDNQQGNCKLHIINCKFNEVLDKLIKLKNTIIYCFTSFIINPKIFKK